MTENNEDLGNEDFNDDEGGDEYSPELLEEARQMGHIPLEDWKGDKDLWTPPDDFVERGKTFQPFLQAERKRLLADKKLSDARIDTLEKRDKERTETFDRVAKANDKAAELAYERALTEIRAEQGKAITDGDGEAYQRLKGEEDVLEKPESTYQEPDDTPDKPEDAPEFKAWNDDNSWYGQDRDMTDFADAYTSQIKDQNLSPVDFFEKIGEATKRAFPEKFTNPNRSKPSNVDASDIGGGGGGGGGNRNKQSYRYLPQDAKEACDAGITSGLFKDREAYVKLYYED